MSRLAARSSGHRNFNNNFIEKPRRCCAKASRPIPMSVPSLKLRITTRAARDFRSIQRYTLEHWGPDQVNAYSVAINLAFQVLRDLPHLGKARDELRLGVSSFPVERHTIYYRVRGDTLIVHRGLHQRVDATREPLTWFRRPNG